MKTNRSPIKSQFKRGFSLLETVVAMVILLIVCGVIALGSAGLERSLVIYDTYSALSDELARQSELVKGMPLYTLVTLTPIPGGNTNSAPYTSTNVNSLNGFLPDPQTGPIRPNVVWVRTRVPINSAFQNFSDSIKITASVNRVGVGMTNSVTVLRLFDAGQ